MHPILKTTKELEEYLKKLNESKVIFLDTEFKRQDTYFPILCLIQISVNGSVALIDPLIKECKLDPLVQVLLDDNIVKVLHSARQDLEIFYLYTKGKAILPIFDTQIAAAFCGYGQAVSYENLVSDLLSVVLDKSQRITDWEKRPLTDRQIKYAINDVLYLPQIYNALQQKLAQNNSADYFLEELATIEDNSFVQVAIEKLVSKIKFESRDPNKVARMVKLISWREELAGKLNLNRAKIITDEEIFLLVFQFSSQTILEKQDAIVISELSRILQAPLQDSELALAKKIIAKKFNKSIKLNKSFCRLILDLVSQEMKIASSIIATSDDINLLVQHDINNAHFAQNRIMKGWRYLVFGQKLEEFFSGRIIVRIEQGNVRLVPFVAMS